MIQLKAAKEEWEKIQTCQRKAIQSAREDDLSSRLNKLERLKNMITKHEEEWFEALKSDLGKPRVEAYTSEIAPVLNEIDVIKRQLKNWMGIEKKVAYTARGKVEKAVLRKPYGSVLIISPWNYPLQLTFVPLAGAIAAGNACFIKPSEKSQAVSRLINKLAADYFEPEELVVVEGEADTAEVLLELNWDYIFFTGSPKVGRKVYEAASRTLTPVTLELGGKNPCIVDETNCTKDSVRKIIWGKFLNAGQTCIAPDSVYIHEAVREDFIKLAIETIRDFYGREPEDSKDYGRLIDQNQFEKIKSYLTQGDIVYGGSGRKAALYIEPTLMTGIKDDSPIATEEIFGPVLPIITYQSFSTLLEKLGKQGAPLVIYLFTSESDRVKEVKRVCRSGAVMINQVIFHAADSETPFGGVGGSGLGRYHGFASYKTFTYEKVHYQQTVDLANKTMFPPYRQGVLTVLKALRKWLS